MCDVEEIIQSQFDPNRVCKIFASVKCSECKNYISSLLLFTRIVYQRQVVPFLGRRCTTCNRCIKEVIVLKYLRARCTVFLLMPIFV